jgi:hypothetical protein
VWPGGTHRRADNQTKQAATDTSDERAERPPIAIAVCARRRKTDRPAGQRTNEESHSRALTFLCAEPSADID